MRPVTVSILYHQLPWWLLSSIFPEGVVTLARGLTVFKISLTKPYQNIPKWICVCDWNNMPIWGQNHHPCTEVQLLLLQSYPKFGMKAAEVCDHASWCQDHECNSLNWGHTLHPLNLTVYRPPTSIVYTWTAEEGPQPLDWRPPVSVLWTQSFLAVSSTELHPCQSMTMTKEWSHTLWCPHYQSVGMSGQSLTGPRLSSTKS